MLCGTGVWLYEGNLGRLEDLWIILEVIIIIIKEHINGFNGFKLYETLKEDLLSPPYCILVKLYHYE